MFCREWKTEWWMKTAKQKHVKKISKGIKMHKTLHLEQNGNTAFFWKASPYTFYHVCFSKGNIKSVWNGLKEGFTDVSWSYTPTGLHGVARHNQMLAEKAFFSLCSFHFSVQALGQTVWKFLAKKLQGSYPSHFSFQQRWKLTWFCQQFLGTLPKA